ncbi:MAG TPA: CocE/NonD family hydrolase [Candidatus Thermoplasmatota archaeon]|nr:CocE/NonD family hydrolase [Candidatus Thermoplasmatota archaeon]
MRRRLPLRAVLVLAMLLLAGCATLDEPADRAGTQAPIEGKTRVRGYLETRDGTLLAYDAYVPGDGSGRWPTLLTYDGYAAGSSVDAGYVERYVPQGYAVVGVSVRGTGCSGGTFDFFEPAQALDGYDAVEWAAAQPWSDGRVGMVGKSFPGITQLFVAAQRPPHLVAAAPGHVFGDVYRDVAYPGGVFNYAFAALWSFVAQPAPGTQAALRETAAGDEVCARHVAERQAENARLHPFVQAQQHPFDDPFLRERSPLHVADRVEVPLYLLQSWQDEQVGVRGVAVAERVAGPVFLTVSNGDHAMYRTEASLARLDRFFERYVKGVENGFEREPRVVVWWDAGADGTRGPSWQTTHDAWPPRNVEPVELRLRAGGRLLPERATGPEEPGRYVYPAGTTSNGAGYGYPWPAAQTTDRLAPPPPTRLVYETEPLARDLVVLGAANLTLRLASTATDTDVQATLSEARPDGRVVFVQKGWLRASHRALDGANSTPYRPFHPHDEAVPLRPGEAAELNVEILPFGHAFRAGSRIQLAIEAPQVPPELWGFAPAPLPAVNAVLHDADHDSFLRLPTLTGVAVPGALPPCGALIRQSCR